MAGYIGTKASVTQVDGYNRTEADDRYVNAAGDTMTGALNIQGSNNSDVFKAGSGGTFLAIQSNDASGEVKLKAQDSSGNNYTKYMTFYTEGGAGPLERMRIDTAGRVTLPYQPAFNATALSSEVLGSGWQVISYNQEVSQRGNSYNAATSTFTAPVNGWYQFNASWTAENNSDIDGTFAFEFNGNVGANFGTVSMSNTGANYDGHVISACVNLAANDYVRVYRYSTVQTTTRGYDWTGNFSGYLIG